VCLLYKVYLRVGCVEYYTATEGCMWIFCWKTTDLMCLNGLNAALDEWHSDALKQWKNENVFARTFQRK
jgi:hypothetical protein